MLQDAQVLQENRDKPSSLLEVNLIASKSSTDLERTNLSKMDIPTTGPPIA